MFCQKCGHRIPDGEDTCPVCRRSIYDNAAISNSDKKSKIAAGLFGIFLGALGIHNFYLGYNGKAIAQLLITILSFGLLAWVAAIWGFIEGIVILAGGIKCDKRGVPLRE